MSEIGATAPGDSAELKRLEDSREWSYDDLVYKFAERFLWIGIAMNKVGDDGMWDEEDGFYREGLRARHESRNAAHRRETVVP